MTCFNVFKKSCTCPEVKRLGLLLRLNKSTERLVRAKRVENRSGTLGGSCLRLRERIVTLLALDCRSWRVKCWGWWLPTGCRGMKVLSRCRLCRPSLLLRPVMIERVVHILLWRWLIGSRGVESLHWRRRRQIHLLVARVLLVRNVLSLRWRWKLHGRRRGRRHESPLRSLKVCHWRRLSCPNISVLMVRVLKARLHRRMRRRRHWHRWLMVHFGLVVVHSVHKAWIIKVLAAILLLGSCYGLSSRLLIIERRINGSIPCRLSEALIMHLLKEKKRELQEFTVSL